MADLKRLSKFLAVLLRHEAEEFGLTLDSEGFTDVDSVWNHITKRYQGQYTYSDLLAVVEGDSDGKKRYEIRGRQIRAMFGHSSVTPITYATVEPPEILYHGTSDKALDAIRATGLKSLSRQYVHMGTNIERATKVGSRHGGKTVMLKVRAREAHAAAGIIFHNPETEHYLALEIPPEFIDFPAEN